jgi:RHS repeat-associated protein
MWLWSVPLNRLFGTAADGEELCHLVDTGLQMKSSDIRVPFDPFGADQEHDASPVRSFQGSPFDSDLEWYDHRARFLDPELGRFTTPDPLGPVDSSNLYTFANNNPLSFRDASGYLATQAPHSISAPLALPAPAMHQHHTMPAFRGDKNAEKQAFFTSRNINVHNYTVNISRLMHLSCVHGRGFFPGASNPESVGRFNDVWDRFMSSNPDAPREAVGVFAEYLGNHYGYGDLTVGPYASGADSNAQSFHFGELSDHIGADHSKSDVIYL